MVKFQPNVSGAIEHSAMPFTFKDMDDHDKWLFLSGFGSFLLLIGALVMGIMLYWWS